MYGGVASYPDLAMVFLWQNILLTLIVLIIVRVAARDALSTRAHLCFVPYISWIHAQRIQRHSVFCARAGLLVGTGAHVLG